MRAQALSEKELAKLAKMNFAICGLAGNLDDDCGRALAPDIFHRDPDPNFEARTSNFQLHHSNSGSSSSHSGGGDLCLT